jgi:hypothetical protein
LSNRTKGGPPRKLTGQVPTSGDSPWWSRVASEISSPDRLGGKTLTIEELAQTISSYPDGRPIRPRTVARRLRSVLRLVSRGPNGSLGRGAVYTVVPLPPPEEMTEDSIPTDLEWLEMAVEKMIGKK